MDSDKISVLKTSFEKKGYSFSWFDTKEEAKEYLLGQISGKTVGIGGSMTVKEMGLYEPLKETNEVHWHWTDGDGVRVKASTAEVYLMSANGLSEKGEVVNIDGFGNRVASTMYGHDTVYIICGENKLAPDFESALYRARNIAAPLNAKRFNLDTPCALNKDGLKCFDCSSPNRICKAVSILWQKPNAIRRMEIVLIGESLGY
jgi:L-lactate utilization protein LutB